MTDELNAWERQPWDTSASFQAFRLYLGQEAPRAVDGAYRKWYAERNGLQTSDERVAGKRATGLWQNWSRGRKHDGNPILNALTWAKRAEAWDDHLAAQDAQRWEQRRAEQREREWQGGQSLFERAEQIAKLPYMRGKKSDYVLVTPEMVGQEIATTTTVEPLNVSAKDEATLRQTASKLGRLAAGMESDRQTLVLQMEKEVETLLNMAREVLDGDSYDRLLARLSGEKGGGETVQGEEE